MKKILLILIISINLIGCGKKISPNKTQEINGVIYEINQQTPYTGIVIEYYDNGQIKAKINIKKGIANGEGIKYYKNGQIEFKGNFKDDKKEGEWIEYFSNGQIKLKENYIDDNLENDSISYYESGQLKDKIFYKNGIKNGILLKNYIDGSSKIKGQYKNGKEEGKFTFVDQDRDEYSGVYKNGKEIEGKFIKYNNEKISSYFYYKDGKKDGWYRLNNHDGWAIEEGSYKHGKKHGEIKEYKIVKAYGMFAGSGNMNIVKTIKNYKNGILDGNSISYSDREKKEKIKQYKNGQIELEENYKDGKVID